MAFAFAAGSLVLTGGFALAATETEERELGAALYTGLRDVTESPIAWVIVKIAPWSKLILGTVKAVKRRVDMIRAYRSHDADRSGRNGRANAPPPMDTSGLNFHDISAPDPSASA